MTSWFKLDKHLQVVWPCGRKRLQGWAVLGSAGVEGQGPSVISGDDQPHLVSSTGQAGRTLGWVFDQTQCSLCSTPSSCKAAGSLLTFSEPPFSHL